LLKNYTEEIIKDYKSGLGCYKLARKYNTCESSILQLLKRNSITVRPIRILDVDQSYFEEINTEDKAFFLGLMITDGCNHGTHFSISLVDEDIVQKFKYYLQAETEVRKRDLRGENCQYQYHLDVSSVKMCKDLSKLGCIPRKTFFTTFASDDIVPKDLKRHYIRGLVCGDGCITRDKKRNAWYVNIVGTRALCQGVSDFIWKELGFCGSVHICQKGTVLYRVAFSGRDQVSKFLHYVFDDAVVCMNRKHQKYLQFCKEVDV
jgi:hypothetical protein